MKQCVNHAKQFIVHSLNKMVKNLVHVVVLMDFL